MADGVVLTRETAKKMMDLISRGSAGSSSSANFHTATDPIIFRNDSGEQVPAYACMKVIDAEEDPSTSRYVIAINKPDGNGGPFIFNGSREVEIGGYGIAFWGVVKVAFTGTAPAVNATMGVSTDWQVVAGGTDDAVTAFGEIDTGLLLAVVITGSGAGLTDCDPFWDTLTIVELQTGDLVPIIRDGCLYAVDIRACQPDDPSGSSSSAPTSSEPI